MNQYGLVKDFSYGVCHILQQELDISNFRTNSKPFAHLCKSLEHLIIFTDEKDAAEFFVLEIGNFFNKYDNAFEKLKSIMSVNDVSIFIDLNYDLLKLLNLFQPRRNDPRTLSGYPRTSTEKEANILEYRILDKIAHQYRTIAEMQNESKARIAEHLDLSEIFGRCQ